MMFNSFLVSVSVSVIEKQWLLTTIGTINADILIVHLTLQFSNL